MSLWRRWVALLSREEPADSLALVRVLAAFAAAWHVGVVWATGALEQIWAEGGVAAITIGWFSFIGGPTLPNVERVAAVLLLSCALVAVGLFTRPAAFMAWFCLRVLFRLNGNAGGSMEELLTHTMFLLTLSGAGGAWSLDAKWRGPRPAKSWVRWVMIGQLVLMYGTTGMQKLSSSWVPGGPADALWYVYQAPQWSGFDITKHPWLFPFTQVGTTVTWFWELGAPLVLLCYWARETRCRSGWLRQQLLRLDVRTLYVLYGAGFHVLVHSTMHVGTFSLASLALYAAWFHPDEWPWRRRLSR